MATYTYGQNTNDYVEVPDPSAPGQTMRPAAGLVVKVRDAATLAVLPDVATGAYGYLTFSTVDVPSVQVSADNFATVKVLYGKEALDSAINAGVAATAAVQAANGATQAVTGLEQRVADVEALVANGGGGSGGGGYAGAAPGAVLVWPLPGTNPTDLPARPTSRNDIVVDWNWPTPPPTGGGYALPGDRYTDTAP